MVLKCCVCRSNAKSDRNLSFHSFPKDKKKKAKWMEFLCLKEVMTWHRVCSLHFNKNDYKVCEENSPYNCLLSEATPQNYNIVSVGLAELQDSSVETSLLSVSYSESTESSAEKPKCKR
ncbi:uncharacterized protein LOC132924255 [Rhopalosiphum padi]|uniref:uncharacterized protein LOC132924255 n=1 Tax=Rhopalosiphum padi TaxID=40932 RepID=UPI00298DA0D5|nr:uncharacterized protein LOC132924255 [Rhopalosiphum padi]